MATGQAGAILQHIQRLAETHIGPGVTDGQLLQRFAVHRDERAFATLVRRHGRLVWGVCRHILHREHDAEDAFQATLLILARRAASIRRGESVGSWLHGVAYRIALKAKKMAVKRQERERLVAAPEAAPAANDPAWRELQALLDEELQRLPGKYRAPFVSCCLEGRSRKEAAAELGWKVGTVSSRIAQARRLLQERLARRGVLLPAALTAGVLWGQTTSASVPAALVRSTIQAALQITAGGAAAGLVSSPVAALVDAAVKSSLALKLKTAALLILGLCVLGAGAGVVALRGSAALSEAGEVQSKDQPKPGDPKAEPVDGDSDPLPLGAVARLGSAQLRHPHLSELFVSPEGKTVDTIGGDGLLRTWDLATAKQLRARKLPSGPGIQVTLSADGKMLVGHKGQKLIIWDRGTGKELVNLPVPNTSWTYFFLSPNGRTLFAQFGTSSLTLWDWKKGEQRQIDLPADRAAGPGGIQLDSSNHASFSPDGKLLATGVGHQSLLRLWDVATAKEFRRFDCAATFSAFSPDGKHLAAVSNSSPGRRHNTLHLWEVTTGKETYQVPLEKDEAFYWWIAFSSDGKKIAYVSTEKITIRDSRTGKELRALTPGRIRTVAFSVDDRTLIGTSASRIRLWDLTTGKELHPRPGYNGEVDTIAFSPDGQRVATASWIEGISLWDAATGRQFRAAKETNEESYVRNLAFSPDGRTLFSAHLKGEIHSWDTRTGQKLRTVQLNDPAQPNREYYEVKSYFLPPDRKTLATLNRAFAGGGKEVSHLDQWEPETGKHRKRHTFPLAGSRIWAPDGQAVGMITNDHLLYVDVATGRIRFQIPHQWGGPIALSPDGALLAAQSEKTGENKAATRVVRLWETATGQAVADVPTGPISDLALPDSRTVVVTTAHSIQAWDIATGKNVLRYAFPEGCGELYSRSYGQGLCLSADGRRGVTPLSDSTVMIWDMTPAKQRPAPDGTKLSEEELTSLWKELAGDSVAKAYQAMWKLADAGSSSVPFLRKQLKPAVKADFTKARQLIADLDDNKFAVREAAFRELEKLGTEAESLFRQVLQEKPSLEVRRRLEELLNRPPSIRSPEILRRLRAVGVLEEMGTSEARQLLESISKGASEARLTQEAKAALERLAKRPAAKP